MLDLTLLQPEREAPQATECSHITEDDLYPAAKLCSDTSQQTSCQEHVHDREITF